MTSRPVALIVMDGYGCNDDPRGNAVTRAATPNLDQLVATNPHGLLRASGLAVGLPEGQMGNSEVGHLNLGAGRIVYQDFTRVSKAIEDGTFFSNEALVAACRWATSHESVLHIMGLVGLGGVHAHQNHLFGLLELASRRRVPRIAVHAFTDGRDTLPHDGLAAIQSVEGKLKELGTGEIATVSGRYYAMDRDGRWDRTDKTYRALTRGEGPRAESAAAAVQHSYERGVTDEFILPTVIEQDGQPVAHVAEGDAAIFFNFRTDRPRQLVRAFVEADFTGFDRGPRVKDLLFVTMTEYAKDLPVKTAFSSQDVETPLGKILADQGLRQLHAAETEKYAHVTFFFNGGREPPFRNEDRILVPSPRQVGTYDRIPEMSADGITRQVLAALETNDYDFILVNFANADMVGHTGSMDATVKAVETVDRNVGRLVEAIERKGGVTIITADHGNAEQMVDYETGGPFTSHTISFPVPFVVAVGQHQDLRSYGVREDGILADVAPTILWLMGIEQPRDMEGRNLLVA